MDEMLKNAIMTGMTSAVEVAIMVGADVDEPTDDVSGDTPLHLATSGGHVKIVEMLLDKGADGTRKAGADMTPLHYAARDGKVDVFALLLERVEYTPRVLRDVYTVASMSVDGDPKIIGLLEKALAGPDAKPFEPGPPVETVIRGESASLTLRETSLGKIPQGAVQKSIAVSKDRRKIAFIEHRQRPGRSPGMTPVHVNVNGQISPPYEAVATVALSPDGEHAASVVRIDGNGVVILDGEQIFGPCEGAMAPGLVFSPDGGRLAFWAGRDGDAVLVVDGEEAGSYPLGAVKRGPPVFSADGAHLAYYVQRDGVARVVHDGEEGPPYDGIGGTSPVFSPTGTLAYVAFRGKKQLVVVDGDESQFYQSLAKNMPRFSEDGEHVGFAAWETAKGGQKVVVDGQASPEYAGTVTNHPVLSPRGGRHAFCAKRGDEWLFVVDGRETVVSGACSNVTFSPDGERLAYVRAGGGGKTVVLDGEERAFSAAYGLSFSPDSAHIAYSAKESGEEHVYRDGEIEGPGGKECGPAVFGPDSEHLAFVRWFDGGETFVVDGVESCVYGRVFDSRVVFAGPNTVRAMCMRDNELLSVEVEISASASD